MSEHQAPYLTSNSQSATPNSQLLSRALLRTLAFHRGRANPITRTDLVKAVRIYGASERQIRERIKQLRRAGHLIGSAPGTDGGYYLITSLEEFNDFMCTEYMAKIKDMSQTANAMTQTARSKFGYLIDQPKLF